MILMKIMKNLIVLSGGIDSLFNNLVKKNKLKDVYTIASIIKKIIFLTHFT